MIIVKVPLKVIIFHYTIIIFHKKAIDHKPKFVVPIFKKKMKSQGLEMYSISF